MQNISRTPDVLHKFFAERLTCLELGLRDEVTTLVFLLVSMNPLQGLHGPLGHVLVEGDIHSFDVEHVVQVEVWSLLSLETQLQALRASPCPEGLPSWPPCSAGPWSSGQSRDI